MFLQLVVCGAAAMLAGHTPSPSGSARVTPAQQVASGGAGAVLREAEKMYGEKKYGDALPLFTKVIALEPGNAAAHNGIGLCHYAEGKVDDAIASFKKASALDPGLSSVYYNLGHCYASKKQWDLAGIEYKKAIKDNPTYGLALYELGSVYFAKKELKKAKEYYEMAAKVFGEKTPQGEQALRNAIKTEMLMQQLGK